MDERFECELCLETYNQFERKPLSLVPCGHSICFRCSNSLDRMVCPYCREIFDTKVPNWEIIKRLPKPVIPILYNQLQIKLNETAIKSFNDYIAVTQEALIPLELIGRLMDRIKIEKKETDEEKVNEYSQRLFNQKLTFSTYRNKLIDFGNEWRSKRDLLRKEIEKEENKYSQENLKKIKQDIEKMNSALKERHDSLKNLNQKLKNTLNDSNLNYDAILSQLETEMDELSKKQVTSQPTILTSLENLAYFMPRNAVAPLNVEPNAGGNNPVQTNSSNHLLMSHKIRLVVSVLILLVICMVYPTAMIFVGSFYINVCPINYLIPIWLIVSGSSFIVIELFIAFLLIYIGLRNRFHKHLWEKLLIILLLIVLVITFIFNISWFIAGNSWIYSANKNVQFVNTNETNTYCMQSLYMFAFWTLNLVYILLGVFLLVGNFFCCVYCFLHSKH